MSVRMGGETPKQFLSLEGVPIFIHTLRKFVNTDCIDDIFVGLRAEDMERAQREIDRENFAKSVRLVAGGPVRQETVARALALAPPTTEIVAVHDAVRPFIEREMIERVVEAARREGRSVIKVWSAGCSSGEEAYTLAMLVRGGE